MIGTRRCAGLARETREGVLIVATVKNEKKEALPGDAQTGGENVDSAEAKGRLAATMIAERLPEALEPTVVEESGVFAVRSKAGRTLALVECQRMSWVCRLRAWTDYDRGKQWRGGGSCAAIVGRDVHAVGARVRAAQ